MALLVIRVYSLLVVSLGLSS